MSVERSFIPLVACTAVGCIVHGGATPPVNGGAPAAAGSPGAGFASGRGSAELPSPPRTGVPRPSGTPGNVTVLDWAGFKAAVSYTFDDANSSQIQHYAELQRMGVPFTFYLITGKPEARDAVWKRALVDGHELGNHSRSHLRPGTAADIDAATEFLQKQLGATAWSMASPFGDASYPPIASTRFLVNRGVVNGLIAPNDGTNPFNLPCYIPPAGAKAPAFDAEIDAAHRLGRWKIVLVHGFTDGSDGAYQAIAIGELAASVAHAKSLGDMWIDTVTNIAAYWRAQKVLSAAAPAASGSSKTWTWTLPAHFPRGKYLRVKVDGGTPSQGGHVLAWNDHGYYEIALDAGSLTLSP
jgi:peptidoglycan/xylan/chitin deacetylase (PgdA/CDA1 family)